MLPVKPLFYEYQLKEQQIAKISKQKVRAIEQGVYISVVEKVNLIALLLGYKWITDIAIGLDHRDEVEKLLSRLGVPFEYNYYVHEKVKYEWLQVAINQPTLDYVIKRRNQLSVLEAGVLYGYPVSAVLAYDGLLEKVWFDKTVAEYYLSGVFSKVSTDRERSHFENMWAAVAGCSVIVATDAEEEFQRSTKSATKVEEFIT